MNAYLVAVGGGGWGRVAGVPLNGVLSVLNAPNMFGVFHEGEK
jgi:hypothetical protein